MSNIRIRVVRSDGHVVTMFMKWRHIAEDGSGNARYHTYESEKIIKSNDVNVFQRLWATYSWNVRVEMQIEKEHIMNGQLLSDALDSFKRNARKNNGV